MQELVCRDIINIYIAFRLSVGFDNLYFRGSDVRLAHRLDLQIRSRLINSSGSATLTTHDTEFTVIGAPLLLFFELVLVLFTLSAAAANPGRRGRTHSHGHRILKRVCSAGFKFRKPTLLFGNKIAADLLEPMFGKRADMATSIITLPVNVFPGLERALSSRRGLYATLKLVVHIGRQLD